MILKHKIAGDDPLTYLFCQEKSCLTYMLSGRTDFPASPYPYQVRREIWADLIKAANSETVDFIRASLNLLLSDIS